MKLCGRVERKPFGVGSKSEHLAVVLVTAERDYVLRRRGGNAFFDAELEKLVGQTICATGEIIDYSFIIDQWEPHTP